MYSLRFATLSVVAALFAAATCAMPASAQGQKELTPLNLRLNWQMKGEFTPFIVAVEKGYFREQGLDVKVLEGSSATQALQSVASGQDDLAYVPSIQLIKGVNQGMPVKAIATVVKVDPMGMVSMPGVPLSSPKDLEGRSVEISAASTFSQIWTAFAQKNNIDVSKVRVVRVAPGARFNLLVSGQVDILADIFMTNEYPVLQARTGKELNTLRIGDWGFKLLGYVIAANNELLEGKPDVLKRFNAGAMKGFRFTMENPDEAAAIAVKAHPKVLSEKATQGQVKQLVEFLNQGEPKELFLGSDEGWDTTVAELKGSGAISTAKTADAYYTNELVPDRE